MQPVDWTPYINTLLQILSVVGVGMAILFTIKAKVHELAADVGDLKMELKQLVAIQILQGRHEERMNAMDNRIMAQGRRIDDLVRQRMEEKKREAEDNG